MSISTRGADLQLSQSAKPDDHPTRNRLNRRILDILRFHFGLVVLLAIGIFLRVAVMVGYGPAFFFSDTKGYFKYADIWQPSSRPFGYSAFLNLFRWTDSVWPIIVVQHLLGLLCAIAVYALVRRKGGARWLAIIATAPLALDGYELVVEHYLLADSLFTSLVLAGIICLVWEDRLSTKMALFAGLFLAAATLTRTVGLPLLILAVLYVLIRKAGRQRIIALGLAIVIPLGAYSFWFHHYYGVYGLGGWPGLMYGRVMSIADCTPTTKLELSSEEKLLCKRANGNQAYLVDYYVWSPKTALSDIPHNHTYAFTGEVLKQQPLDFAALIARETWTYFSPDFYLNRQQPKGTTCPQLWEFQVTIHEGYCQPKSVSSSRFGYHPGSHPGEDPEARPGKWHFYPGVNSDKWEGAAPTMLHSYQRYGGITPGPFLAICLLLVIGALVTGRRSGGWRLRWDALFLGASGVSLLVMAIVTSQFDIRYGVPTLALIPPAGALAWISLRSTFQRKDLPSRTDVAKS